MDITPEQLLAYIDKQKQADNEQDELKNELVGILQSIPKTNNPVDKYISDEYVAVNMPSEYVQNPYEKIYMAQQNIATPRNEPQPYSHVIPEVDKYYMERTGNIDEYNRLFNIMNGTEGRDIREASTRSYNSTLLPDGVMREGEDLYMGQYDSLNANQSPSYMQQEAIAKRTGEGRFSPATAYEFLYEQDKLHDPVSNAEIKRRLSAYEAAEKQKNKNKKNAIMNRYKKQFKQLTGKDDLWEKDLYNAKVSNPKLEFKGEDAIRYEMQKSVMDYLNRQVGAGK